MEPAVAHVDRERGAVLAPGQAQDVAHICLTGWIHQVCAGYPVGEVKLALPASSPLEEPGSSISTRCEPASKAFYTSSWTAMESKVTSSSHSCRIVRAVIRNGIDLPRKGQRAAGVGPAARTQASGPLSARVLLSTAPRPRPAPAGAGALAQRSQSPRATHPRLAHHPPTACKRRAAEVPARSAERPWLARLAPV